MLKRFQPLSPETSSSGCLLGAALPHAPSADPLVETTGSQGWGGALAGGGRRAGSLAPFPSHTEWKKILAFRPQGTLGVGHVTKYLEILRCSFVPQEKALFYPSELLVPAYSHIRLLPGMALEADGCSRWLPGWGERKVLP